jgi:nitrite reductase/ring-hydroxylating ferredoxin subunit
MNDAPLSMLRLTTHGREAVIGDVASRLNRGEVLLLPNGAAAGGGLGDVLDIIWSGVRAQLGAEELARLHDQGGLSALHKVLSVDQVDALHSELTPRLTSACLPFTERFARSVFGVRRFWVNLNAVMRFYLPNAIMQTGYARLRKKKGKLVQHGPHHDYWQGVALNALNIWIALEDVEPGHGMTIYADDWGKVYPRGAEHVREDQRLSPPLEVTCSAGDVILFHSQHLHAGVLNRTDRTRVVLTTRVVLEPPEHPRFGSTLVYYPAWLVRAGLRSTRLVRVLDMVRPVNLLRKLEMRLANGRPGEEDGRLRVLDRILARHWFPRITDQSIGANAPNPGIEVVDSDRIRVTTGGQSYVLSRRCPHQGGDLACGYVKQGLVHCPLHDQPFDPRTGAAAGEQSGLRPLQVHEPHLDTA